MCWSARFSAGAKLKQAVVIRKERGELRLRPIQRNISYTAATAREIVAHWRKSKSSTA